MQLLAFSAHYFCLPRKQMQQLDFSYVFTLHKTVDWYLDEWNAASGVWEMQVCFPEKSDQSQLLAISLLKKALQWLFQESCHWMMTCRWKFVPWSHDSVNGETKKFQFVYPAGSYKNTLLHNFSVSCFRSKEHKIGQSSSNFKYKKSTEVLIEET